jgi:hypothetical protein
MKELVMTSITIDNNQYEFESLTEEAKAQLLSLQFVDQELQRLQAQTAAYQTARIAYAKALNEALPLIGGGDIIEFQ